MPTVQDELCMLTIYTTTLPPVPFTTLQPIPLTYMIPTFTALYG